MQDYTTLDFYSDKICVLIGDNKNCWDKIPNKAHKIITGSGEFKLDFTDWFTYLKLRINI